MALTPEQRKNAQAILTVGKQMGASKKALKAALEAGITESSLRNLPYGDRDSVGVFQQRPSQGWKGLTNVSKAAQEFFKQAIPNAGKYGTAGQLAQSVQRSAYPGRYDQNSAQANALLGGVGTPATTAPASYGTAPAGTDKRALALSLLGMGGGYGDPLTLALQQATQKQTVRPSVPQGPQPTGSDIAAVVSRAKAIDSEKLPYKWGGGHGSTPSGPGVPLDCSGAVSRLLNVSPRVSGDFAKFGKPGAGQKLTIYANGKHVLMGIRDARGVEHLWGTSSSNPGGGAGWIPRSQISPGYLKGFSVRHPPNM